MIYRAGYAETIIGESHRHLATPELEQTDRYLWHLVCGTSRYGKLSVRNSMWRSLNDTRLMVGMLPKSASFGLPGGKPFSSGGRAGKKPKPPPQKIQTRIKRPKRKYQIKEEYGERPFRKFGYDPNHAGRGYPDPESKRSVIKDQLELKGNGGQKGQKGKRELRRATEVKKPPSRRL